MTTVGGYFVKKSDDVVAIKENIIAGDKYRFTFLTDRLVRLEYNPQGKFEDRATQNVIYRKFPKVDFQVTQTEKLIQITTSYFILNYVKNKPFSSNKLSPGSNLMITLKDTDRTWYYNHPEARNFGGITYSLDNFKGLLKLDKGFYSTDGFTSLDDSNSLVLNKDGNFAVRESKSVDIYVFMYRKDLGFCLQDYYTLTGYPMMLPRYAFGTWWYKNQKYDDITLINLLQQFKEEDIPLCAVMLGDKWHLPTDPLVFDDANLSGNRFEEIANSYGVKTGVTLMPSKKVKKGTLTYSNIASNVTGLGENDYSFLPISNQALNLYTNYGLRNLISMGIDSFVIDYNNIRDKNALALLAHYCYSFSSLLMNKRMVIFSRNHNLAVHRNTVVFTGRTKVDWETLSILPRYNASASNNGISYVASAIGGYQGGIENAELYIRYIQLGVFSPILVLASDDGYYYRREPWRWNSAVLGIIKKYLQLRNKLIPYLYTEGYIYHNTGSPIAQPLYYKYPKIYDEPLYKNQYFFGSQMLVCPITKKKNLVMNRVVQRMFIPEGIWYEFESGKRYLGNKYYMSFYRDEDYPVFCREGAIIPLSLDETANLPINMEFVVVPGSDGHYTLYEDDGITNNYVNESFALTNLDFKFQKNNYQFTITNTSNPGLLPDNRNYRVRFKNTKKANVVVSVDGFGVESNIYLDRNDLVVEINKISTSRELKIVCSSNDSIENSTIRLINDDIRDILEDLEIETSLKTKIDAILFGDMPIKKKRMAIRKLKRQNLDIKFIKMFLNLLEYIESV